MKRSSLFLLIISFLLAQPFGVLGQKKNSKQDEKSPDHFLKEMSISGLKFRSVGPALMSGRISDFAVNPENPAEYYVATSSGGIWKTVNAGTTYEPIGDGLGSYSMGVVTLDPNDANVVWLGTGENNNQRSVAYGNGLYKSVDRGGSWEFMGLPESEHIGSIVVDPRNSEHIFVAAIGPLWSAGGDRGVYETTDGGKTWERILYVSEHTGINELHMDPRNPDILYASALQRRRRVFTYLGGGPESGLYKSVDGGKSWKKINKGLPDVDLGRIGLAISPADPDILYAIVEAAQGKSGFFRSRNGGASWEKRSGYSTSGNYYQEIIADPRDPDRVYAMDTWMHFTRDGGKTFDLVGEVTKHVDNHAMWIDPQQTSHWLVGCDGGVYETWDAAQTWHFKANLPVTQFYKVSVDEAEPFYNIYGGTQDNFSFGGPSRTRTSHGIMNSDWFITQGGDGFETQVDPNDPNIIYAQSQYGNLVRFDKIKGEQIDVQPKPGKDEPSYRWNWDAPLVLSAHEPKRLYFAANKLFRTDDRGDSWEVISGDLTRQINRNELKVMGRIWGIDAVAKNGSTSPYGTIVALSESPLDENLLYVGTDDGLVQVTEDGGRTWRTIGEFPGVPERTYVNMLVASRHDANVVYACFNNHKNGDFKPYVFRSGDKGKTWSQIISNLPERGSAYSLAEDPVEPNLLFVGTEFGVFFTPDGGKFWKQLKNGLPTIAVRDIAIQERETDLVLGTFGRGFFVLDDYSVLRQLSEKSAAAEAELYPVRTAWLYEQSDPLGLPGKCFQGDNFFSGENLDPVAIFTYYLKDDLQSPREERRKQEAALKKEGKDVSYPTYEELRRERETDEPKLLFTVKDASGNIVRKLETKPGKGLQRLDWDLRYSSKRPVRLQEPSHYNPWASKYIGPLVPPGGYTVEMAKIVDGQEIRLSGPVTFQLKPLPGAALPVTQPVVASEFKQQVADLARDVQAAQRMLSEMEGRMKAVDKAILLVEAPQEPLLKKAGLIRDDLRVIRYRLNGDPVAYKLDLDQPPSVSSRINGVLSNHLENTSGPTQTQRRQYAIAREEINPLQEQLQEIRDIRLRALLDELAELGAPYVPE